MKRRTLPVISMIVATMFILTGCAGSASSMDNANGSMMDKSAATSYSETGDIYSADTTEAAAEETEAGESDIMENNRKLIKTVDMNVETEEYDTLMGNVQKKIDTLGGYISNLSSGENGGSYGDNTRYATITAKIPAEKVDQFVTAVSEISNVTSKNESVDDVTLQYVDLESHKKALLTEQESLLKLMENATNMEDIITIESRLSDVRYQIESMESQLRTFDNQISFSEVTIYISEVSRLTPMEEVGTWEKISTGFMLNVHRVAEALKNFLIGFLINLPIIAVLVFIGLILFFVIRFIDKKSKIQRDKQIAKRMEEQKKALQNAAPVLTTNGMSGNNNPTGYSDFANQRNNENVTKENK